MAKISRRRALATSAGAAAALGGSAGFFFGATTVGAEVAAPKLPLAAGGLYRATFYTPSGSPDGKWPGGGPHSLDLVLPSAFEAIGAWATEYDPKKGASHAGNAVVVTRSVQLYGEGQERCRIVFDILHIRGANEGEDRPYVDPTNIGVSVIGWAPP
jgi:hypothetical protein